MTDLGELAYLTLRCSFCGALPGEWCVTRRPYRLAPGRRAIRIHEARQGPLMEAWRDGLDEGYRHGLQRAAGVLRRTRAKEKVDDVATTYTAVEEWLTELAEAGRRV